MKKLSLIFSYPLSVIFYLLFGLTLVVFHPIQWVCFKVFGYLAHKKSVDYLNFFILMCLRVLGTTFKINKPKDIPENIPLIIVSNHQSLWDIPPLIWYLRKHHPKFVSKKELGKGIPSISFNLKNGGSVLIDRNNPGQALEKMIRFAKYLEQNNRSGVIFPEGTRGKTGIPKKFHHKGLTLLFKKIPEAYVLPLTINNSWKLQRYGLFPIPMGVQLKFTIHPILKVSDFSTDVLTHMVEKQIIDAVVNN